MELNLHPIATKCFVSGREFAEDDRVVCYLIEETLKPANGPATKQIVRRDVLESEDAKFLSRAFVLGDARAFAAGPEPVERVYCRWVVGFKPRRAGDNPALALKLTAENLFLTLATPAGASPASGEIVESAASGAINTPLLQFLTLMLERKKLIKHRGRTEDGARHLYEHMPSHQFYEVPAGDLNREFFQKIQEHLGVLVGNPKPKAAETPAPAGAPVAS